VHGVAAHAKPVLVFTEAPPGVVLIDQVSVVPRAIVAQPDSPQAIATKIKERKFHSPCTAAKSANGEATVKPPNRIFAMLGG
jgi:hypothetical protein